MKIWMQNTCVGTILQRHVILSCIIRASTSFTSPATAHTLSLSQLFANASDTRSWHCSKIRTNRIYFFSFHRCCHRHQPVASNRIVLFRLNLNLPPFSRLPFCRQRKRDSVNHLLKVTSHFRIDIFSVLNFSCVDFLIRIAFVWVLSGQSTWWWQWCWTLSAIRPPKRAFIHQRSRGTFNDGSFYIVFSSSSFCFLLVASAVAFAAAAAAAKL